MKSTKCIAIIGSTGKAGRYILAELLRKNYAVRALVRNPPSAPDANVEYIIGDVRDYTNVTELISGCDAVVSALGHPGGDKMIFTEASGNIMRAMETHRVKRYILIGGINIDFPNDRKGPNTQVATDWMRAKYPKACEDRQEETRLLNASTIHWTMIRSPIIRLSERVVPVESNPFDCIGDSINVGALAEFLVSQLESELFIGQAPFIWNR